MEKKELPARYAASEPDIPARKYARLHGIHWVVLLLSVLITLAAWQFSDSILEERTVLRFEREAQQVINRIKTRLSRYEDALLAGRATMLNYNGQMSHEQWRDYATALDLTTRYPGVNGIGIIREVDAESLSEFEKVMSKSYPGFKIYPPHEQDVHFPIVHVEPETENATAIGLDIAFEANRREAALISRDRNISQISGPISLVQENLKTGFLFYVPFYKDDGTFDGFIYSPLVVKDLISGALDIQPRHMEFSIHDDETLIYNQSDELRDEVKIEKRVLNYEEDIFGRTWKFSMRGVPEFGDQANLSQPLLVLISGLIIDAMLFLIFLLITRSSSRVENLADELRAHAEVLAQKNDELESFAYVVSHDLKTPILAIYSLAEFIGEDLEDVEMAKETQEAVSEHLVRIKEQVERSQTLIQGILSYSVAGMQSEPASTVDVKVLIGKITTSLGIPNSQIETGLLPTLYTQPVRITQIFENLIGNAYKYHPAPHDAKITISAQKKENSYRFFVKDNGGGIDQSHQEFIFKPFTTLQILKKESSGIGLSIVKKSVEKMGGSVGVISDGTNGAKFYFDWPMTESQAQEQPVFDKAA